MARLEDIKARGASKEVVAHEKDRDLVRCFFHTEPLEPNPAKSRMTQERARGTFLLQRLANIFLPDVIPAPRTFGYDEKSGRYYMDVQRIPLDAFHLKYQANEEEEVTGRKEQAGDAPEHNWHELEHYVRQYDAEAKNERMNETLATLKALGFKEIDDDISNWTLAENKVRFLDMPAPWYDDDEQEPHFDLVKLERSVSALKDPGIRTEARAILEELRTITPKKSV